jgi:hypothetical protein
MGDSDMEQRTGRSPGTSGREFDLVMSKLRHPVTRPGIVGRSSPGEEQTKTLGDTVS